MKKSIYIFLILLVVAIQSCSPTKNMQQFYSKYDDRASVIPLPSFALKLASAATGTQFFSFLKSSKVFIVSNANEGKQKRVMKDLQSAINGEKYENLLKIKAKDNRMTVAVKESKGRVNQMIFGINGLSKVLVIDSKLNVPREDLDKALDALSPEDLEDLINILK